MTVAGTDRLHAAFNVSALSERLEAGYRYASPMLAATSSLVWASGYTLMYTSAPTDGAVSDELAGGRTVEDDYSIGTPLGRALYFAFVVLMLALWVAALFVKFF